MFNAKRLLDQFLGAAGSGPRLPAAMGGGTAGALGGAAPAALAGGIAGLLLGTRAGRRLGGTVLRVGGAAAVGALAWRAYQAWQSGQAAQGEIPPAPEGTPFAPTDPVETEMLSRTLLTAMIAAAKADGTVDAQERAAILGELDRLGLSLDDRDWLAAEFAAPLDLDALVQAATSEAVAVEIYTASLIAIEADTPAEKAYLALLAARLGLAPELVARLDATVASASG